MSPPAYSFSFEPIFLGLVAVAALAYVRAARRARPPLARIAAFSAGLLIVAVSLNSPIETLAAHYLVLMHLTQNALTADWAPLLLILGLTPVARSSLLAGTGRALLPLAIPWVALLCWLVTWYGTHLAPAYDYALRHTWALNAQHAALILAGLLFWWPVLLPEAGLSKPGRLAYLGAGFAGSIFLSLAFIFSSHPFYAFYAAAPRLWGLSPVKDQNLGGIVMNGEQTIIFLGAIGYFLLRLLDEEEQEQRVREETPARDEAFTA